MMSPSSTSTTTAATATVVDADTNSVGADNQATFYREDSPNPTATDLSCCNGTGSDADTEEGSDHRWYV